MPKIEQQPVMFGPQNPDVEAQVQITPREHELFGLAIKAIAGQSVDLVTIQNSAGATTTAITSAGSLCAATMTVATFTTTTLTAATSVLAPTIGATTATATNIKGSYGYFSTMLSALSICAANLSASNQFKAYGGATIGTTLCAASITASTTLNVYGAATVSAVTLSAWKSNVISFGVTSISGEQGTSCKVTFPLNMSVFLLDGTTSGITGTLPAAAVGTTFFIKKVDAVAAAANLATVVSGNGASITIDGATHHVFAQGEGYLNVVCTCANSTYACIGSGA